MLFLWFACSGSPSAPPPPKFAVAASPEALAADAFCRSGRGEGGQNAEILGFDNTVFAAIFPKEVGAWVRKDYRAEGHGIPVTVNLVTTAYVDGERKVQAFAADRIHDCTAAAGTGDAMLAALGRADGMTREATTLAAMPAVLYRNADAWALEAWFGDRCQIVIGGGGGVTRDEIVALGAALDLRELDGNCRVR